MSVSNWHRAEGHNRRKSPKPLKGLGSVVIEVGTSEENPVYRTREFKKIDFEELAKNPEVCRVADIMTELIKDFNPALAARKIGIKWLEWRPVLLKHPRFKSEYMNYVSTKGRGAGVRRD